MTTQRIEDQVTLPVAVAFQVVLQGMKTRFGRSLVTIMGVVLGIAFLMSILTAQVLKSGVAVEQKVRAEHSRMMNFLIADMGLPAGKTLRVLQAGGLSDQEQRFLRGLAAADAAAILWVPLDPVAEEMQNELSAYTDGLLSRADLQGLLEQAEFVLLMGEGGPSASEWNRLRKLSDSIRLGTTRILEAGAVPVELQTTALARVLRPEEIAKQEAEARTAEFRNIWIIVISLLVTVIGIANAMLMSVTERFREIGTMKCLGALSAFIRQIFLFESCLIGAVGGLLGALAGALFSILVYAITFGFDVISASLSASVGVLVIDMLLAFAAGVILSILAAIYPANVASKMVPADALRSNI